MEQSKIFGNRGLSAKVADKVREIFPSWEVDAVTALLLQYGEAAHEYEIERVRMGILRICKSDAEKVRDLVMLAKKDYRDLIVAAEYEVGDGKLVVKRLPDSSV